jgi:di/tricarboxylate transporter
VIGFVLALGIPSMTVRTAILIPIAWSLVKSLGIQNHTRGSALIILTSIEMAVIPGLAFLYGSLDGPVVAAAFAVKHLPLTWGAYAQVMTLPTVLLCTTILVGNQFVLRPEAALETSDDFARMRLRALGPFQRAELITAIVVTVSIALWASETYHHIPAYVIGMLALAVFTLADIVTDADVGTGVSWSLLLFLGGIFSLANVIQEYKVTDWLARYIVPAVRRLGFSSVLILIGLALAMYVLRFLDPSSFIAIPVLFLAAVDVTTAAGIQPLVVMAALLLASVPFWFSYQNFWIAMGEGITSNQAFTAGHRSRLATTYAVLALAVIAVSASYWKLIGVL